MKDKSILGRLFAHMGTFRIAYIVVLTIFLALGKIVRFLPDFSWRLFNVFALLGAMLLLLDFFRERTILKTQHNGYLALFLVVLAASSVVNAGYGIKDNIKTFVWTCIQMFLMMSISADLTLKELTKQLRIVAEVFIAIWFAGTLVSFGQFLIQYHTVLEDLAGIPRNIGFVGGRLFGVFSDPNYSAILSVVAIILAVFLLTNKEKPGKLWRTYYIVTIVVEFFYIVLSGSRTASYSTIAASAFACALLAKEKARKCKWPLFLRSVVIILGIGVGVVGMYLGMTLTKDALAYAPEGISKCVQMLQIKTDGIIEIETETENEEMPVDMSRPDVENNKDISNSRFKIWVDYIKIVRETPLLGTSPNNYLAITEERLGDVFVVQRQYSVHNGYLSILVCTGILGALCILVWMIMVAKDVLSFLIRKDASDPQYVPVAFLSNALLVIAISAVPLQSIFLINTLNDLLFWVILGFTLSLLRLSEPEKYSKAPILYRLTEAVKERFKKTK